MATQGESGKFIEQHSEDVSCGREIQSKVPVPPPRDRKMSVSIHPPEQLGQLFKLLRMEEKALTEELGRRKEAGSVDDVVSVIMSGTHYGMPEGAFRRLPYRPTLDIHYRSNLSNSDCSSGKQGFSHKFISSLVDLRQVPSFLLMSALRSNKHVRKLLKDIQLKANGASSVSKGDVGQKQKAKLQMDRDKSLSEEQVTGLKTQKPPKDMASKLDILDGAGDEVEVEMDRGKSAVLEELVQAEAVMVPNISKEEMTIEDYLRSECLQMAKDYPELSSLGSYSLVDDDDDADGSDDEDKEEVELDRVKSLLEQQSMGLEIDEKETQQLPNDMANKLDILDVGGDEAEVEMDRGKSLLEEQVIGPSPRETEMEREHWKQQLSQLLSELESFVQVLKELKEAGRGAVPEVRIEELSVMYIMITKAIRNAHLLLKRGDTEAGSRMPNWVWDEVEWKQMTEAGIEDRAKSFLEKQVIGPLPRETEMEGESGKQQQSQLLPRGPEIQSSDQSRGSKKGKRGGRRKKGKRGGRAATPPARLQHDSAMDLKQVQGSNDSKPRPTVGDMHRLGLEWEPPRLDKPDLFPNFVMPESRLLELHYPPKDDVSGAGASDDDMQEEMDSGKSAQQIANEEEEMAFEAEDFALYRRNWESWWEPSGHGFFEDMTTVSPMHFTHWTPGCSPHDATIARATLQIFTIKLTEIRGGLKWPLSVYGVVAARDCVDRNRNLLFSCDRWSSQKLSQHDPFLHLIGPSRAIVFTDPVDFEIELRVKGRTPSQDRALITQSRHYTEGHYPDVSTIHFSNCFCTTELCMEQIDETVQATILGVRVKNGPWPFDYGGQVACISPARTVEFTDGKVNHINDAPSMEVVLLASRGRTMPKGSYGYLRLSRHVVSVELEGSLKFIIQAYSESGDIASQGEVCFMPKACNISQKTCFLGDRDSKVEVEITVAWSLLVSKKEHMMI